MALKRRGSEKGAATVEFALSALVLVPLALCSIFAGEVFLTGFRAQEAEMLAAWDVTAYRLHQYDKNFPVPSSEKEEDLYDSLNTDSRYLDTNYYLPGLDSRTGVATADQPRYNQAIGRVVAQVRNPTIHGEFGAQKLLSGTLSMQDLQCSLLPASTLDPKLATFKGLPLSSKTYLNSGGYVGCRSTFNFANQLLSPRIFHELFPSRTPEPDAVPGNQIQMCGIGGTVQGCDGKGFVLLADDWALDDGSQHRGTELDDNNCANKTPCPKNKEYYNLGKSVYWAYQGPGWGSLRIREALGYFFEVKRGNWDLAATSYSQGPDPRKNSSAFRLTYASPINGNPLNQVPREYLGGTPVGPSAAHVTPWDDGQGGYAGGQQVWAQRRNGHYLGQSNRSYNEGWWAGD